MLSKVNKNKKTIVGIFAHPDDEAFGPSGTLAKYAKNNDLYLICATKGEAGIGPKSKLSQIRSKELEISAKIIGAKKVYFLGFGDGTLSNNLYHKLAAKIERLLKELKPEIIITHEQKGISGHIDHITVAMVTTFVFKKLNFAKKLMYYCIDKKAASHMEKYFIYFPPGYTREEVDQVEDISAFWDIKKKAMFAHKSQLKDAKTVLKRNEKLPKEEYFFTLTK